MALLRLFAVSRVMAATAVFSLRSARNQGSLLILSALLDEFLAICGVSQLTCVQVEIALNENFSLDSLPVITTFQSDRLVKGGGRSPGYTLERAILFIAGKAPCH